MKRDALSHRSRRSYHINDSPTVNVDRPKQVARLPAREIIRNIVACRYLPEGEVYRWLRVNKHPYPNAADGWSRNIDDVVMRPNNALEEVSVERRIRELFQESTFRHCPAVDST